MTTTEAIIGYGCTLEVETAANSGVYYELGEVTNITPPNAKTDQVDVTHMKSPDRGREFISGLKDGGETSIDFNYIPGGATADFVAAWRASSENRSVKLSFPADAEVWTFPGFPLGFAVTLGVAEVVKGSLNLKVAGAVSRT